MKYTDPRDRVTPEAFVIAPALLGVPLARPWRRGAAITIDLALVSLLARASGVLLGFAAAGFFFRISARGVGGTLVRRSARLSLRATGALVLFITSMSLWDGAWERLRGGAERQVLGAAAGMRSAGEMGLGEAVGLGAQMVALQRATTEADARKLAHGSASRLAALGTSPEQIGVALRGVAADIEEKPGVAEAIRGVADSVAAERPSSPSADSLLLVYAAARETEDTAAMAAIRPALAGLVAADTLAALGTRVEQLRERNSKLRAELAEATESGGGGIVSLIRTVADELGLGFGWAALYFTAFLVLWRGQTPGKRLLGIRVLRLDGRPITWWVAFERFGGYLAGVFTGLLDYFLILRDRNRQALHDKIVDTVVVWEPAVGGTPGRP